jgi:TolA-binding protein
MRAWAGALGGLLGVATIAGVSFSACWVEPPDASQQLQASAPAQWQDSSASSAPSGLQDQAGEGDSEAPDQGSGPIAFSEENLTPPPPSPTPAGLTASSSPGVSPGQAPSPGLPPTPGPTPSPSIVTGAVMPSGLISDQPLPPALLQSASPTQRIGLGIVEQARGAILNHDPDGAIRSLGRGLSIDPGDPYIYFYLGRAYLAKRDYAEALTFWQRAAIGFVANNPQWLGETYSFEGAASEGLGNLDQARHDYQRALAVAPDNQMAQLGLARLGPPPQPSPSSTGTDNGLAPPLEATPAPPPVEAPPAPAP